MRYQITNNVKSSQQPAYNIETQRDIEILLLTRVWSTEVCLDLISCGETLRNIFSSTNMQKPFVDPNNYDRGFHGKAGVEIISIWTHPMLTI